MIIVHVICPGADLKEKTLRADLGLRLFEDLTRTMMSM